MRSAALPQVREKRLLMKDKSIDLSAFVQKNGMPETTDDEVGCSLTQPSHSCG